MYLFFRPGEYDLGQGAIGFLFCIVGVICLFANLSESSSKESSESHKQALIFSFILLIVGIGICGTAG